MIVIGTLKETNPGEFNLIEALALASNEDDEEDIIITDDINDGRIKVEYCQVKIEKLIAIDPQNMNLTVYHYHL